MMQELSMNVLDIAENSVAAGAKLICITLAADTAQKRLTLTIADDGCGMSADTLARVTDPFCTGRKTRKVGLGLPFLKMAAEMTDGTFAIESALGVGTTVTATFTLGHIDLAPIGALGETIAALLQCNPDIDFTFIVRADKAEFCADTRELREILGGVSFAEPEVAVWLREYLEEHSNEILKRSIVL
ncbi:MAG: ATP-binding protein [Oscillospiraceae bacterium]|nr:ATP-binding protein [Oscillospiraceae bacterium]